MKSPRHNTRRIPLVSFTSFLLVLLCFSVSANAGGFPYVETFEGGSGFDIPAGSGWGVVDSHGPWTTFLGNGHLDNDADGGDQQRVDDRPGTFRAIMHEAVTIPKKSRRPILSFWYKFDLGMRIDSDRDPDQREDNREDDAHRKDKGDRRHPTPPKAWGRFPDDHGHRFGDSYRIYVDVQYTRKEKHRRDKKIIKTVRVIDPSEDTGDLFRWMHIPLDAFRGEAIRVSFRQEIGKDGPGRVFVVDNFRIDDESRADADRDGVPDTYDPTPHGEKLPAVTGVTARMGDKVSVAVSWSPFPDTPFLAGYRMYRREADEKHPLLLNPGHLFSPDRTTFTDTRVHNATHYTYTLVAVAKDGTEGEPSAEAGVDVSYLLTPFPYEEGFDSVAPKFAFPEKSKWSVAKDHDSWTAFSGLWHLDGPDETAEGTTAPSPSRHDWWRRWQGWWEYFFGDRHHHHYPEKARMTRRVHIPKDAKQPILSFWYQLDLPHWGDAVVVDIHYIERHRDGPDRERVDPEVLQLTRRENTARYAWVSVPLRRFKGTEVWAVFRQGGERGDDAGMMFVADDFRISEKPRENRNHNRIPDAYETPLNADMLPYAEHLTARASTVKGEVDLSWDPIETRPGFPVLAGYTIYRRTYGSDAPPEKITPTPIPAEAISYADLAVENDHGYYYRVVGVSDRNVKGYPSRTRTAYVAYNTLPVENFSVVWDQGKARLDWDKTDGYTYRVYRQTGGAPMALLAEPAAPPFIDETSQYVFRYDYQVASVKGFHDPFLDKTVFRVGPLSPVKTLEALPAASVSVDGAETGADGTYIVHSGPEGSYLLEGTYSLLEGDVVVTARSGDTVVTGTGSGGHFSVTLSAPGTWSVTLEEKDGWRHADVTYDWQVDDTPPHLAVDGPDTIATDKSTVTITGTANDDDSPMAAVVVTSDQYAGKSFAAVLLPTGAFSCEVPLKAGANHLIVSASDSPGNVATHAITATLAVTAIPVVQITAPAAGISVTTDTVDVTGTVRSSLPPEQIRLVLGNRILFPTAGPVAYEYAFTFPKVKLISGPNTLTVRAETNYGNVSAQTFVTYTAGTGPATPVLPTIEVLGPLPDTYLTASPTVRGIARSDAGIRSVTVNGQTARLTGAGTPEAAFEAALTFASGDTDEQTITVAATDTEGHTGTLTFAVHVDTTPPVIALAGTPPAAPPTVNPVVDTPYEIAGTVTERNLAAVTINGQNIGVVPGASPDQWNFTATLPLVQGETQTISLVARDLAGHQTGTEWLVRLDAGIAVEMITPRDGAELTSDTDLLHLATTARITGMTAGMTAEIGLDGAASIPLTLAGTTATAGLDVDATQKAHRLLVSVKDASGTVVARHASAFTVVDTALLPLAVQRQEPANNAEGVEPNAFIAFYFNKPMDPAKFQVSVRETVHGMAYAGLGKAAGLTELNDIHLVEIDRDQEPVPGGISHFPNHTMAAFYPQRDFAYGATIYVTVTYDGAELFRSSFAVRPLPTFVQGFVSDQFDTPLAGITVSIPKLNRTAVTNSDGAYGFGFGDKAAQAIPAGRYRAVINPDLANRAYGTVEKWVDVQEGRLNTVDIVRVPALNTNEPFRHIVSHATQPALLANGTLRLDLSNAGLLFPDGRDGGDVHVQFMTLDELSYPAIPGAIPHWVFSVQPMGVEVTGTVGITIDMPALYGSTDYISRIGNRVVLIGYDPDAMRLVPVGVGEVHPDTQQVTSIGPVALKRLDYIGYALVDPTFQPTLDQYVNGEITLNQLTNALAK